HQRGLEEEKYLERDGVGDDDGGLFATLPATLAYNDGLRCVSMDVVVVVISRVFPLTAYAVEKFAWAKRISDAVSCYHSSYYNNYNSHSLSSFHDLEIWPTSSLEDTEFEEQGYNGKVDGWTNDAQVLSDDYGIADDLVEKITKLGLCFNSYEISFANRPQKVLALC
ncbi:hypothetical protein M8C21_001164, partial [Ambrosia artemisiifolia]